MFTAAAQQKVAVLIFADSQQHDLRRKGFSSRVGAMLSLPKLDCLGAQADVHWFCDRSVAAATSRRLIVHRQRGKDFGQRLENAVEDLAAAGYKKIVIVGRDCPQLSGDDVSRAIDLLDSQRLVIGPDHRGGCWLIALHAADRAQLRGVRWQCDTDAAELIVRFGNNSTALLEQKFDLDHAGDLRELARIFSPAAAVLAFAAAIDGSPTLLANLPLSFVRLSQQIPPPTSRLAA